MYIQNLENYFAVKKPRGVIHIGAHNGEEKPFYTKNKFDKIIWIDADPQYEQFLKSSFPEDMVIICGIGSKREIKNFNRANNGESSSFLDLDLHKRYHPGISYVNNLQIQVKPMVYIVEEFNINIKDYNFLNLDVQGVELDVLKGFGDLLDNFDYVYTEINTNYIYKNCSLVGEIDTYLKEFNFTRSETYITPWEWGDALYTKSN